jgi:hypothetical protein
LVRPGAAPQPAPGNAGGHQRLRAFRPGPEELDDDDPRSIYDLVDDEAA